MNERRDVFHCGYGCIDVLFASFHSFLGVFGLTGGGLIK